MPTVSAAHASTVSGGRFILAGTVCAASCSWRCSWPFCVWRAEASVSRGYKPPTPLVYGAGSGIAGIAWSLWPASSRKWRKCSHPAGLMNAWTHGGGCSPQCAALSSASRAWLTNCRASSRMTCGFGSSLTRTVSSSASPPSCLPSRRLALAPKSTHPSSRNPTLAVRSPRQDASPMPFCSGGKMAFTWLRSLYQAASCAGVK
jgi:hypothetical protein